MKRTIAIIAMLLCAGCAKRFDTTTQINSVTKTTIEHEGSAPVSQEIPMAAGTFRHNVDTGALQGQAVPAVVTTSTEVRKSLRGKNLIEVTFVKQNGQFSVLESVETGERFQLKGSWGREGDRFRVER